MRESDWSVRDQPKEICRHSKPAAQTSIILLQGGRRKEEGWLARFLAPSPSLPSFLLGKGPLNMREDVTNVRTANTRNKCNNQRKREGRNGGRREGKRDSREDAAERERERER